MTSCFRRYRRKVWFSCLLWLLFVFTSLRLVFLFSGNEQPSNSTTFLSFVFAPFLSVRSVVEEEFKKTEEYHHFERENRISEQNDSFIIFGKEKIENLKKQWKMKLRISQNGHGGTRGKQQEYHNKHLEQADTNKTKTSSKGGYGVTPKTKNISPENPVGENIKTTVTTNQSQQEVSATNQAQQRCKVPDLDPFHADAQPFISYKWRGVTCDIKQKGYVRDGKLFLNLKRVQRAGYYYVRSAGEDSFQLSEYHSITDLVYEFVSQENEFCMRFPTVKRKGMMVTLIKNDLLEYSHSLQHDAKADLASTASVDECNKNRMFVFREDKLYHAISNRCIVPKASNNKTILVLSESPQQCERDGNADENLKFVARFDGTIQHTSTNSCITFRDLDNFGFFFLGPCVNATLFSIESEELEVSDLSIAIPLEEDFVRLEYVSDNQFNVEFHMYPVRQQIANKKQSQQVSRDPKKLNILMLMVDSLSRASVQRYMKATYDMLEKDPNSIIMKGQTINGDGTTAQILAMFMGKLEKELPEARKGFPNATYIDSWPFMLKEYEKMGYQNLYSEDAPDMNIFNYRLKGFKNPPAAKYLRPWWLAADPMFRKSNQHSQKCQHMFAFDYIKNYYREYKQEKKFIFHCSNIAHNNAPTALLMDEDMKSVYDFLRETGDLDNTVVIFFADHGDRTAEFRASMQGKLEERLPFLSFTFPSWFRKQFPGEMENFRRNSEILTTHYDTHATLKHLQNFPEGVYKHKFGHSFFTDITKLNRACKDAGIDSHWCPCLSYKQVETTSELVQNLARSILKNINRKLSHYPKTRALCTKLTIGKVISANQMSTNKDVEDFFETKVNSECDECGVVRNKTLNFKKQVYEITFTLLPSHGNFEASVEYNIESRDITVGEISRINRYGNQPHCIQKELPYMRKFCYCNDLKTKTQINIV